MVVEPEQYSGKTTDNRPFACTFFHLFCSAMPKL
jgi:hypothetical protein